MTATIDPQTCITAYRKRVLPIFWRSRSFSTEIVLCLCAVLYALLTSLHLLDWDVHWQTANALSVFCVTLIAATKCPQTPVLGLMLISSILWCESDLRSESSWWNYLLAYSVRCASTALLIVLTSRAQRELQQARQAARVDSLTGILNRMAIQERLETELSGVRRYGRPLSIVMLDCDGFKEVNDRQGHQAGDNCLKTVARTLSHHIRPTDYVGRLGGDEFVILFPDTAESDTLNIIERLRDVLNLVMNDDYPTLTFSIGVSTIQPPSDRTYPTIDWLEGLRQADEAMYAAKRSGGDQTRCRPVTASRC